jgi:hypothetical protein
MSQEQNIITELIGEVQNGIAELQQVICELDDETVVLDSVNSCNELIKSCNLVLENVEEMKSKFDDERDMLCALIHKMSYSLPFIERIKCRAKARGVILGEFTIHTIPKEAAPFYGDDELSCEIIRVIEEERARLTKE